MTLIFQQLIATLAAISLLLGQMQVVETFDEPILGAASTMKFLIVGADNTAITTTTTYNFVSASHQSSWNTTETNRDAPVAAAMTLSEIYVRVGTAPGAGQTRTFTIMKNGATTAVAVTISGTDVQNSTTGQAVSFAAGDTISLEASASATAAGTTDIYWTVVAESVSSAYFVMFGGSGTSASATATVWQQLQSGTGTWLTAAASVAEVMPLAGTITTLYADISAAPGAGGDAYTITVLVDEVASALAVTWTDAETGIKSDTGSVAITAGQTVGLQSSIAVTPTARAFAWSVAVTPTTAGESALMFGNADVPSAAATEYEQIMGGGNNSWITTEANRNAIISGAPTIQAIYAKVGTAPDNGAGTQSWTFTLRETQANTAVAVAIEEAATTNNSTESFVTTDFLIYNWASTPASTPAAMTGGAHLGLKIFFAVAEVAVVEVEDDIVFFN